jgi:hypothetical protein
MTTAYGPFDVCSLTTLQSTRIRQLIEPDPAFWALTTNGRKPWPANSFDQGNVTLVSCCSPLLIMYVTLLAAPESLVTS